MGHSYLRATGHGGRHRVRAREAPEPVSVVWTNHQTRPVTEKQPTYLSSSCNRQSDVEKVLELVQDPRPVTEKQTVVLRVGLHVYMLCS